MPQLLTDLIQILPQSSSEEEETPEDIFSSAPGLIFPDYLRNHHGEAGDLIIYKYTTFGGIELSVADPHGETSRWLFGHYLWNAGILLADRLSGQRSLDDRE